MINDYWQRQTAQAPLFPDIQWSKPEVRSQSGRLAIIGGNKLGFSAVAESYTAALKTGAGEARVLLPDALKKSVPASMTDVVFGASNPSGGLSREAESELQALAKWATGVLLIGDAGRNSETAMAYEKFIQSYAGPLTITRDAVDLLKNSAQVLAARPETQLVLSYAQLQKLFQAVYYPKVLTFSLQLAQAVEAVHKFTITYPLTILTFHKDHIIVAHGGRVTSMPWDQPLAIWRGETATRAACYRLWHAGKPYETAVTSLLP